MPDEGCATLCGKPLKEKWHLLCPECWNRLTPQLQNEVFEACVEAEGSKRHLSAMLDCIEYLLS